MRARLTSLLAALALLGACQVQLPSTGKKATPRPQPLDTAASAAPSAAPSPDASASPSAKPSSAPSTAPTAGPPAPPAMLQPPKEPFSELKGVARLDGAYIVASGAGNIIASGAGNIISGNAGAIVAAGGGQIVASGAGNIISGNGGAAIANASGQIVASGAGNIIASGAGNIISGNAGAIVATGGGNIVASGAGNIISGNGGAIVAQGAGNRRLLEATDDARMPVAGMPLEVYSLQDHQRVPVGVDADGKPVYTVYTNATGGFQLWLPKAQEGNVLVVAQVKPESADPRLSYGLMTESGTGQDVSLDEDTAQLTTWFRRGMGPFLAQGMLTDDPAYFQAKVINSKGLPLALQTLITGLFHELRDAGKQVHVDQAPVEEVQALVQRMVDRMLTHIYLGTDPAKNPLILTRSPSCNYWHGPDEPAAYAMLDIMRLARQKTREKLAADKSYFDHTPYVRTVNAIRQADGLPPYHIAKDTDLFNMIVAEYFLENDDTRWAQKGSCHYGASFLWGMLDWIFTDIGMQTVDHVLPLDFKGFDQPTIPYTSSRFGQSDRAEEGFHAVLTRGFTLMASPETNAQGQTVHDEIFAILRAFKPSSLIRTSPTPHPSPDLPCKSEPTEPPPASHAPDPCVAQN